MAPLVTHILTLGLGTFQGGRSIGGSMLGFLRKIRERKQNAEAMGRASVLAGILLSSFDAASKELGYADGVQYLRSKGDRTSADNITRMISYWGEMQKGAMPSNAQAGLTVIDVLIKDLCDVLIDVAESLGLERDPLAIARRSEGESVALYQQAHIDEVEARFRTYPADRRVLVYQHLAKLISVDSDEDSINPR